MEFPLTFVVMDWRLGSLVALHYVIVWDMDQNDDLMDFSEQQRDQLKASHPTMIPMRLQFKMQEEYVDDRMSIREHMLKTQPQTEYTDRHSEMPHSIFSNIKTFYEYIGFNPETRKFVTTGS